MTHRSACSLLLLVSSVALMGQSRDTAYLKVKANTGRAGVFVDGKYLGPAANFRVAKKYAVTPGKHEIKLSEPRFKEAVVTEDFQAGKTTVIKQTLEPLPLATGPFGVLRVHNADKFAAVYINQKFYGHAGEFNNVTQGILLPPGDYDVRIEPASGNPLEATAHIEAGKAIIVR